jgi:glycosyltransferase involved in cell wall biosynthesis
VTIVIPVFRTEEFLGECLESVLSQTFDDFEVIVVDDCSPGDVAGIVASVAAGDARVRVIRHAVNEGPMRSRFTGGRHARGEYLAFVDSDDAVEDFFLMQLHSAAVQHDADLVDCSFVMEEPDGRVVNRGGEEHTLAGSAILCGVLDGSMSNSAWSKLTRSSTWRKATARLEQIPQRIDSVEDLLCLVHVAIESERFAHTSRPAYRYLVREGSLTNAVDLDGQLRNLESLDVAYSLIRSTLERHPLPQGLVEEFFTREFVSVGREILRKTADLLPDTPPGLPRSAESLGLLGAVAVLSAPEAAG